MDWRDFMRGFFGGGTRNRNGGDQWPPPPPIEDFFKQEGGAGSGGNGGDGERGVFFEGGRENRRRGGADEFGGGFEDFGGNRFVFGDLFSAMGEMFREMERSMRDMDSFFEGHPGGFGGGVMIPALPGPVPSAEDNPKAGAQVPSKNSKEDNIRDLVLKEPEVSREGRGNSRHCIPPPKEKVDRDLDDLHQQSKLDLSDLPVPSQQSEASGVLSPFGSIFGGDSDGHGRGHSTFQRTYQTFSFKNGRWEGEIVKEDQNGKEVTRYYQDAQGQKHETTEYFPRSSEGTSSPPLAIKDKPSSSSEDNHRPSSLFPFFERFFKPKM